MGPRAAAPLPVRRIRDIVSLRWPIPPRNAKAAPDEAVSGAAMEARDVFHPAFLIRGNTAGLAWGQLP